MIAMCRGLLKEAAKAEQEMIAIGVVEKDFAALDATTDEVMNLA